MKSNNKANSQRHRIPVAVLLYTVNSANSATNTSPVPAFPYKIHRRIVTLGIAYSQRRLLTAPLYYTIFTYILISSFVTKLYSYNKWLLTNDHKRRLNHFFEMKLVGAPVDLKAPGAKSALILMSSSESSSLAKMTAATGAGAPFPRDPAAIAAAFRSFLLAAAGGGG